MDLPTIGIIIPTLNSAKTLGSCLDSILMQDYPKEKLEVIIADGGSTDGTMEVIKSKLSTINYQRLTNPLKTGEAGKAVGVKKAKNEIIALIDSDNILPQADWLKRMVEPFQDKEIVASEPLYYTYRKADPYITRYCALLGINDPICLFLGNYDRFCLLTGRWTEVPHKEEDNENYLKIEFPDPDSLPTIGANGFLIRRDVLQKQSIGDYLFDIDTIYDLSSCGCKIAKVKTGIVHLYCNNISQFIRKQRRRIRDYNYYKKLGLRKFPWGKAKKIGIIKFFIFTILALPLLFQGLNGVFKKRDPAWFFHPIACWLTLLIYGYNTLINRLHFLFDKKTYL